VLRLCMFLGIDSVVAVPVGHGEVEAFGVLHNCNPLLSKAKMSNIMKVDYPAALSQSSGSGVDFRCRFNQTNLSIDLRMRGHESNRR
jgi:hypothetical protein